MDTTWDGVTRSADLRDDLAKARNSLADAAQAYDWPAVFEILSTHRGLLNSCRLGGKALYAPLHQAAHAGASVDIVRQLIDLGAWRTLPNASGERAADVAERLGHRHLQAALAPLLKHQVPIEELLRIQSHFHAVIRGRIDLQLPNHELRLPELAPLLELERPQMWFPVPGMYGGFSYHLDVAGATVRLVSESWWRVVEGSGQRHEVSAHGGLLVDEGFV